MYCWTTDVSIRIEVKKARPVRTFSMHDMAYQMTVVPYEPLQMTRISGAVSSIYDYTSEAGGIGDHLFQNGLKHAGFKSRKIIPHQVYLTIPVNS